MSETKPKHMSGPWRRARAAIAQAECAARDKPTKESNLTEGR